jgi:hypothetical protein
MEALMMLHTRPDPSGLGTSNGPFKIDIESIDPRAIRGTVDAGVVVDLAVVTDKPYEATRRFYKCVEV